MEQLEEVLSKLKGNLNKDSVRGLQSSGYKLFEEICETNLQKVRKGEHVNTEEEVTIKIARQSNLTTPEEISMLRRKVENHARLDHPHIVYLYEVN